MQFVFRKKALKIALFATLALAAFTFLVMTLWNMLMPGIFAVHAITFWQALGLLVLSKLLFGPFRGFSAGGPRFRRRILERLTPEQRDKLKAAMQRGCGPADTAVEA